MRSRLQQNKHNRFSKILIYVVFPICVFIFLITTIGNNDSNTKKIDALQARVATLENNFDSQQAKKCDIKNSLPVIRKSIVRIIGGEAEGSGFFIDNGLILTNFHVIEFEASPKVVYSDNTFESAEIYLADKEDDLALLKVNKQLSPLITADSKTLTQTDELYSMGFPFGGELQGELTVTRGILAGVRLAKDSDIEYLQTDSQLNPGVSGGPMTNDCGQVVGINTLGGSGVGFAISSDSISKKLDEMKTSGKDPLKDITVLDIQPNVDSLHAVTAFYDYLKLRRLDKAFALLGDYKKDFSFDNWKKGYAPNLDTSIVTITQDDANTNKVNVKLTTKDIVDGEIVYKYFEGYWLVKNVNNKLLLNEAHIKEVTDPDYSWFYQ